MLKTCSEMARIKGITRQSINEYILKNAIKPAGKKGKYPAYDVTQKPLSAYLGIKEDIKQDGKPGGKRKPVHAEKSAPPPSEADSATRRISKPLNDLLAGRVPADKRPAEIIYAEAFNLAKQNQDAALFLKLGQIAAKEDADEQIQAQALKTEQAKEQIAQEKADRLKIENDIRKGMYLEYDKVKGLFGRVYAVHTSILTPLSLKLSTMLAAVGEGSKKEATMRKLIDDEIYSALGSIKKILADFVRE